MTKREMSLQTAVDIMADMGMDDLPDGAYWAVAHDLAGAEYGEVWNELDSYPKENKAKEKIKVKK